MSIDVVWVPYIVLLAGIVGIFWLRAESRRLDREEERAKQERLTPR